MLTTILEILKYTVPSLVVFGGVYSIIKVFIENENKRRNQEINKSLLFEQRKVSLPLRLQAYERILVLLERIHPFSLLTRVYQPNMLVAELQLELIKSIRIEYEYNLSQQMYINDDAWQMVSTAKEETIKVINLFASKLPDDADGIELNKAIFNYYMQSDKDVPVQIAINYVKSDVKKLF
ncbi:MAG: hypothetical protein IT275_00860 [Chitinophagales bacterium]|nr:hypothetical protein [Chitinophagales bacterium]HMV14054.1 hypothetical protein [Chitinophagales bacterium]HMW12667.1 hypothetical protein [Chitinophagales bacterium]HMX60248.1 hypothetical protein [Chitinophagales bacterium]HMY22333.1 hypothetical protein [Chitinophagales bacterium]